LGLFQGGDILITQRILYLLEKKSLKPADLCRYLDINTSTMTNWKQRNTDPPAKYIAPICEFLNVSCEYLLTGNDYIGESEQSEPEYTTSAERQLLDVYRKYEDNGFSPDIVDDIYAFFPELEYNISISSKEPFIQKDDIEWISLIRKLPERKRMEFKSRIEGYLECYEESVAADDPEPKTGTYNQAK
jgi:transcriptional regulator with XRE-family HTH domain